MSSPPWQCGFFSAPFPRVLRLLLLVCHVDVVVGALPHSAGRVPDQRLVQPPRAALRRSHVPHCCRHRRQRQRWHTAERAVGARSDGGWRVRHCGLLQSSSSVVCSRHSGVVVHHDCWHWVIGSGQHRALPSPRTRFRWEWPPPDCGLRQPPRPTVPI